MLDMVAANRFWNDQIDPHSVARFGFAFGRNTLYIIQLPPHFSHTNLIFNSHDFLNTPVSSLQAILYLLSGLTYLDIPGEYRRYIVEQAGFEPANIVMDRATANLSKHDDVITANHATMRIPFRHCSATKIG